MVLVFGVNVSVGLGAAGVSHNNLRTPNARATPALPNTPQKTTRRNTVREKKSETGGGRGKTKAQNFGPPTLRLDPGVFPIFDICRLPNYVKILQKYRERRFVGHGQLTVKCCVMEANDNDVADLL